MPFSYGLSCNCCESSGCCKFCDDLNVSNGDLVLQMIPFGVADGSFGLPLYCPQSCIDYNTTTFSIGTVQCFNSFLPSGLITYMSDNWSITNALNYAYTTTGLDKYKCVIVQVTIPSICTGYGVAGWSHSSWFVKTDGGSIVHGVWLESLDGSGEIAYGSDEIISSPPSTACSGLTWTINFSVQNAGSHVHCTMPTSAEFSFV